MRRIVAVWQRRRHASTWPINESAGRRPADWKGWPGGKQFAVVLTHDVEGRVGLERCRHLAQLEMGLGFRSSFNFVPEGAYSVPQELRLWLAERGFEVGVHDLKHDGKLYQNLAQYRINAVRINQYLEQWNADGFRSAFMHHHQEWMHSLNVKYDASTFDTDPFEPQPDGVGTIFPFWVPAPNSSAGGRRGTRFVVDTEHSSNSHSPAGAQAEESASGHGGFVELPYTLPQDSTLFLLLREKSGEIWRRKLDWVASRGGMMLINVHPDYLHLRPGKAKPNLSAEDHYFALLSYLNERYKGAYWHVLPREMAEFVRHS